MVFWNDRMTKLKSLPNTYVTMYITAKVLGGVSIGMLLAYRLPTWTWWIFLVIACAIAIPVALKILK